MLPSEKIYCKIAASPIREEPTDAAQMVNQWLLGESATLLEQKKRWYRIKRHRDGYEGWVNANECSIPNSDASYLHAFEKQQQPSPYYCFTARNVDIPTDIIRVPFSAPIVLDASNAQIMLPFGRYEIVQELRPMSTTGILSTAASFLGTHYLWGGVCELGIDCSGLVQTALHFHAIAVPRDASQQIKHPLLIQDPDLRDLEQGDLLFFNPDGNRTSHVAFYAENYRMIHASGSVRYDALHPNGVEEGIQLNERYANSIQAALRISSIVELPYSLH